MAETFENTIPASIPYLNTAKVAVAVLTYSTISVVAVLEAIAGAVATNGRLMITLTLSHLCLLPFQEVRRYIVLRQDILY